MYQYRMALHLIHKGPYHSVYPMEPLKFLRLRPVWGCHLPPPRRFPFSWFFCLHFLLWIGWEHKHLIWEFPVWFICRRQVLHGDIFGDNFVVLLGEYCCQFKQRQQRQQPPTRSRQQDHDDLLYKLESAIQRLYDAGACKIVILGLPPIGCFPMQVTASSLFPPNHWFQRNCDNDQNSDSESYNNVLQSRLSSLRYNLQGHEVSYADIYTPMMDMIHDPRF
ncbi:hypothetical protein MLD38_031109 [Melastoma candidum]|nr:hypothetical protein MLD38_031109 [Melastoma candidum]